MGTHHRRASGFRFHLFTSLLFVAVYLGLSAWLGQPVDAARAVLLIIVAVLYGLLPDIDVKTSRIYRFVMGVGLIALIASLFFSYVAAVAVALVLVAINLAKHRRRIHTYTFLFLAALPLLLLGFDAFLIAFASGAFHLLIDR